MISYLRGKIFEYADGKMTVLAGDAGVGYSLTTPQNLAFANVGAGQMIELFVHTHVREDALDLYGFSSRLEKDVFLTLLSVNGIGPKVAMGILSKVEPDQLVQAILEGDKDFLVQIPGIGKKTAERVVLELADPIRKKFEGGMVKKSTRAIFQSSESSVLRDAKAALLNLGYREQDIGPLLNRVASESPSGKVEDLIKSALQQLI